jgi:hypothetical protein
MGSSPTNSKTGSLVHHPGAPRATAAINFARVASQAWLGRRVGEGGGGCGSHPGTGDQTSHGPLDPEWAQIWAYKPMPLAVYPRCWPPIHATTGAASPARIIGRRRPCCRCTHLLPCAINHRRPGTRCRLEPHSHERCAALPRHRHGQASPPQRPARAPRPRLDSA